MPYQHGITIIESNDESLSLVTIGTAVIGVVVTGPAADAAVFPLDKPVLIPPRNIAAAIAAAGATGTIRTALEGIAREVKAPIVLVRVVPGADAAATEAAVIGTDVGGVKTGMQALLAAPTQLSVRPRIIGVPGLDSQAVTEAIEVLLPKLRGFGYAFAHGDDSEEAIAYRANFSARELMLITPDPKVLVAGVATPTLAVATALGARARIDQEQGWHKTISNVPLNGIAGLTKDFAFDLQDVNAEVNLMNANELTTIVNLDGRYRFWGSRTCSADPRFVFESATRTAQVLADTIALGMVWAMDKPLRPSLAKDIVEMVNGKFRDLQRDEFIVGAKCWFDPDKNPVGKLKEGKLTLDYDYTPVPPLENLLFNQKITDSYLADFASGVSA